MIKRGFIAGAVLFACCAPASAKELQPIQDFIKRPTYSSAKISPNGDYLPVAVAVEVEVEVEVDQGEQGEQDILTVLGTSDLSILKVNRLPDDKSVGAFHWVGPERLLFNSVRKFGSFAQPRPTGEWYRLHLVSSAEVQALTRKLAGGGTWTS